MIVLDASVLIAFLDAADAHHERAAALLSQEIDDDFAVNILTLAEILVAPTRAGRCDQVLRAVGDLEVETLQFPADAAVTLAELGAQTLLKMPDCCVLLSALDRRARLASFDDRLIKAARARDVDAIGG
ncbi:MAG TPA: type II toxin-antitoxin system VapC family toxin [Kineosporiaceae bacterium]